MRSFGSWQIAKIVMLFGITLALCLAGCPNTDTQKDIIWTVTANDTANTTAINFTFGAPVSGLTVDNITLTDKTGSVTPGILTGGGITWSLAITVTSFGEGNISVSINKSGIENKTEIVLVLRPITWTATANEIANTTAIEFVFDVSVSGLTVDNITVADETGAAQSVALTGSGTSWSLAVTVVSAGNIAVSITKLGIENKTVYVSFSKAALAREISTGGGACTVAIKTDGTLWVWGVFWSLWHNIPALIGLDIDWTSVSTGYSHTLAIKTDGTLWAWGGNTFTQIEPDTIWTSVSIGYWHALAIKADGSLWAWGENRNGQLGDGTTINRNTPTQIESGAIWTFVSAGIWHTLAIKADGTLWAWGNNDFGQLGDGTTINRDTPTQIEFGTTWTSVFASFISHTVAIKTDGTLWAWGNNGNGQLGDGTDGNKNHRYIPVQIIPNNNIRPDE